MDITECVESAGVHHSFQVNVVDVVSSCSSVSFVLEYYSDFHYLPLIKSGKKQQNNKKTTKKAFQVHF